MLEIYRLLNKIAKQINGVMNVSVFFVPDVTVLFFQIVWITGYQIQIGYPKQKLEELPTDFVVEDVVRKALEAHGDSP